MHENVNKRIQSVDILRGLVMMVMALDHVRDFFHIDANVNDPLNLETTNAFLFFTRYITHFCAPIFVFLSGLSIYLQSLKKSPKQLQNFLISRGVWLIFVEIFINTFLWTFNPFYNLIILQVFWSIGMSMILLGLLIKLPKKLILIIALLIIFGHNFLDFIEQQKNFDPSLIWKMTHAGGSIKLNESIAIDFFYPFLPWTGIMFFGYYIGFYFNPSVPVNKRNNVILTTSALLLVIFIILRWLNFYGDPFKWEVQNDSITTFLSFLKVHKYPPSLLYVCVTISIGLFLLYLFENYQHRYFNKFEIFGRTAFFYYIMHLVIIHSLAAIIYLALGNSMEQALNSLRKLPLLFMIPEYGFSLTVVYIIWIIVLIILYPICKWYNNYKTANKHLWWLSYL